jgi:hypothetical protein
MEVPHTNRFRRHLHHCKSFKTMQSLSKSKWKTGKMKLQKRRSWPESNKRLKGSVKNRKSSQGGRQQLSVPKPEAAY